MAYRDWKDEYVIHRNAIIFWLIAAFTLGFGANALWSAFQDERDMPPHNATDHQTEN